MSATSASLIAEPRSMPLLRPAPPSAAADESGAPATPPSPSPLAGSDCRSLYAARSDRAPQLASHTCIRCCET
eukprot:4999115-Prymnesium_polylepis.1